MATSKSMYPFSISGGEVVGTDELGARLAASWAASPAANTATRTSLPVSAGSATVPRTIWSALRGSTPRRNDDLDRLVELRWPLT